MRDQLRYARFHMGDGAAPDGSRLLTAESLAAMQTPQVRADTRGSMGLTWFIHDTDDVRIFSHGGATLGQMSAFLFVPSRSFALTILTNADRGRQMNNVITKWALDHYLGVRDPEPERQERPADALAPYAGRYSSLMQDLDLRVGDGVLILQDQPKGGFPDRDSPPSPPEPPTRLVFCGPDEVVALDPPYTDMHAEFLRDAAGNIAWLRAGGRIHKREDS